MATNFKFYIDGVSTDFSNVFVPRDIFSHGTLWGRGNNWLGSLGDNSIADKPSPVQTYAGGTNWKQVSCGYNHTGAIKTDGTLWMWGNGTNGRIGDGSSTERIVPVQTISSGNNWRQVSCGWTHTGAIKTDGTLWMWGDNAYGPLGDNTIIHKSSPVQTISAGNNWKEVSCGQYYTAAIKTDGTLWLWGTGESGRLGDNTTTDKSSPVQTVAGGTNWKQVSCKGSHTAAIKTDGTLWTWGENTYAQLGDNSITFRSSPVQTVAGGTNWKQVSCSPYHTGAIKTDGTLWMWGRNRLGSIGDNSLSDKSSPVQTYAGGTNWKQVACGGESTSAIKIDGSLWGWGYNFYGQVDESKDTRLAPIQVSSGSSIWKYAARGEYYSFAITDIF